MQLWFDFLSGYDLQIQIIIQIMTCDLKIKKTNQFKCDCDFDLQYCDLYRGLACSIPLWPLRRVWMAGTKHMTCSIRASSFSRLPRIATSSPGGGVAAAAAVGNPSHCVCCGADKGLFRHLHRHNSRPLTMICSLAASPPRPTQSTQKCQPAPIRL